MSAYSQTATAVVPGANARRRPVTLAETVSAGMPGYIATSGLAGKADGNDATKWNAIGYFEQGGAAGQKVNLITDDDDWTPGITMAVGDILILSATPGSYDPSTDGVSGTWITVLAVAKTTTKAVFRPISAGAVKA